MPGPMQAPGRGRSCLAAAHMSGMNLPTARQPRGIPIAGQFARTSHQPSGVHVSGPRVSDTGFEGRHSGQPDRAPGSFGGNNVDLVVDTVMSGPLSRGIASVGRRAALKSWHDWAQQCGEEAGGPDYADFASGLKTGTAALYEEHLGEDKPGPDCFDGDHIPVAVLDLALQAAAKKRTSGDSREHWRRLLKHTPSGSWHRGHLAAGVILSGADGYWGMRESPEHAVKGDPAE